MTYQSCDASKVDREPIFKKLMDLDANPTKKHGRGKKAKALADDPRSLVQQFSDRFRALLIGGNSENPSDLRHGPKYI